MATPPNPQGSGGTGDSSNGKPVPVASLMDLISADPIPNPVPGKKLGSTTGVPHTSESPARVAEPQFVKSGLGQRRRKPLTYSQLARLLNELAGSTTDQKSAQKQLRYQVFPKLAVYNSVDPSLVPSLLHLHELSDDRVVVRYVYYYLARVLAESAMDGIAPGGVVATPNWDALATLNASGAASKAKEVIPQIVQRLTAEAADRNSLHARRIAALKALSFAPTKDEAILEKLYVVVFKILDKVADAGKLRRKRGFFGRQTVDKESATRSNLQYAALSALRRFPLDTENPAFLHRAVQGIACADPVGVRHALSMVSELAPGDPYTVAISVAKLSLAGGSLQEVLQINDVLARVYLARLCYILCSSPALDEKPDLKSHFRTILYQLLLDPSERVCFEAITCILGKVEGTEGSEIRARGWAHLISAILKFPEPPPAPKKDAAKDSTAKDGVPPRPSKADRPRPRRPQPLIKLVMRRMESALRTNSRPVLHGAARVVQEMGKSRAAAFAVGFQIDEDAQVDGGDGAEDQNDAREGLRARPASFQSQVSAVGVKETITSMLTSLMEAVRIVVACECVYVRAAVIKAMIWMLSPFESVEELKSIIAEELSDPAWPPSLLNDLLLTLHARFKATPEMAVILLDISRLFATKVPGKIDSDVLQLLWKTCLLGSGPEGKHTALEAVTIVLDLPPPPPSAIAGFAKANATDPKSALALQRLIQAAVWFLGENANYAAAEYAWDTSTPPAAGLLMLDSDKMVAAANSRNPTLAGALTRLQRCAFSGSWEVRIVAAQALITIAIRSGEPYRLQIYDFLHALARGGTGDKFADVAAGAANGEDQGASGTGLSSIISPMLKVLDEMYKAQDQFIKDVRHHDNRKEEWTDDELKKLFETHEGLLDLVALFCFIPRSKYLPIGPTSAYLLNIYRKQHQIVDVVMGLEDPAIAQGISGLLDPKAAVAGNLEFPPIYAESAQPAQKTAEDEDDEREYNEYHDFKWNTAGQEAVSEYLGGGGTKAPEDDESDEDDDISIARSSTTYDDIFSKGVLDVEEDGEDDGSSGASSPESAHSAKGYGSNRYSNLFASSGPNARRDEKASSRLSAASSLRESISKTSSPASSVRISGWKQEEVSNISRDDSFNEESADVEAADDNLDDEIQPGRALYDFTAGGDDELSVEAGEELEIEYEVDGWFFVKKKTPGPDGKVTGLVPAVYVSAF